MDVISCRSGFIFFVSRFVTLSSFIFLSVGCVGLVKPVSEDDRDTSGSYDGRWLATHTFTAETQIVQNWRMTCNEPSEKFGLVVSDGVLWIDGREPKVETYISSKGEFRLEMPTSSKIRESEGTSRGIGNGKITMILLGDFSGAEPKGVFTMGIAQLGNAGCTSKYSFAKI